MTHSRTRTTADHLRTALLEAVVLPLGDRILRQKMMRRLRFLREAQWWDRGKLCDYRDRLLRRVVQVAYSETPFYRRLWDAAGVDVESIRTAADLERLPIVDKPMLREAYPQQITRKTSSSAYEVQTSGSSGEPFRLLEDAETAGWYRATLLQQLRWAGWRPGERHLQIGMNPVRDLPRRVKDAVLGCHYMAASRLSDSDLDAALRTIERKQIDHVWGYPTAITMLAERALETENGRPLRSVVTWGDSLASRCRDVVAEAFQTRVLDTYGCCEGMHIAAQCGCRDLYHIHMLDVVAELLDDRLRPVADGEAGHFIVTRLHAGAMPLIRYRIGDLGMACSKPCPCGRQTEMVQQIIGRDADAITTPDGNRLVVNFFTTAMKRFDEIDAFQIVQTDPSSLTIRVTVRNRLHRTTPQRVVDWLRTTEAGGMRLQVVVVPEIPLTRGGKRRLVVNHCETPRVANLAQ